MSTANSPDQMPFPLTLTPKAVERVRALMAKEDAPLFLRVAVKGGGCAGFSYAFTLEEDLQQDDREADFRGVRVVVDPFSAPLVVGATLDYVESLAGSQLMVSNPRARTTCGCGASFSA
jgi:iron-sulfur cluster assembly accessory protein